MWFESHQWQQNFNFLFFFKNRHYHFIIIYILLFHIISDIQYICYINFLICNTQYPFNGLVWRDLHSSMALPFNHIKGALAFKLINYIEEVVNCYLI